MSTELLSVLENIEREKGISREVLIQSIEAALVSAAKKVLHDKDKDVAVKINLENGKIQVFSEGKEVVSNEFGRIAAQTAKQVLIQKIREAERAVIYSEFSHKAGTIINGAVYRLEKGALLVDRGKTEAMLPKREQSPRDSYHQGDRIRAYVLEVNPSNRGHQIILSRVHPGFVKQLFELEVPEISEGIVEIRSAAREAGDRSKIAVWSKDDKVDSVGACVGMRGSRVKGVVKELQGEKIDIVRWSENVEEFVTAALSPAEIASVKILNATDKKVEVIVADDQLSLAIGKNGQNVRLASKLCGWSIDIRSKKDIVKEKLEGVLGSPVSEDTPIESLEGIGPKTAEALAASGYKTVKDLQGVTKETLTQVKGIGDKTADKILEKIGGILSSGDEAAPTEALEESPAPEPEKESE